MKTNRYQPHSSDPFTLQILLRNSLTLHNSCLFLKFARPTHVLWFLICKHSAGQVFKLLTTPWISEVTLKASKLVCCRSEYPTQKHTEPIKWIQAVKKTRESSFKGGGHRSAQVHCCHGVNVGFLHGDLTIVRRKPETQVLRLIF